MNQWNCETKSCCRKVFALCYISTVLFFCGKISR
nr:MAG TPA: hypothetical protein [Caudoviricetes sp.]